jgi:beta-lactamase regulating signal transducer with metallopeptidase domain
MLGEMTAVHRAALEWLSVLLDAAVKATVLLALAALAVALMRRASAAAWQFVWVVALAALPVLPVASQLLPAWRVLPDWASVRMPEPLETSREERLETHGWPSRPRPPEPTRDTTNEPPAEQPPEPAPLPPSLPPETIRSVAPTAPPTARRARPAAPAAAAAETDGSPPPTNEPQRTTAAGRAGWAAAGFSALVVWGAGTALCLLPLAVGRLSLWRLARRATPLNAGSWAQLARRAANTLRLRRPVALLQSHAEPMPMVWGVLRTKLLVPAEANTWSARRRWVVLLHELAHIKRRDCLAKLVAHLACAVYWFNPLCWVAYRRMQREAEAACDDLALASGHRPSDYAEHLLSIASGLRERAMIALCSIAMARKSKLEGRLLAILDGRRSRRTLTRQGALLATVLVLTAAVPLSLLKAVDTRAQTGTGEATVPPRGQVVNLRDIEQSLTVLDAVTGRAVSAPPDVEGGSFRRWLYEQGTGDVGYDDARSGGLFAVRGAKLLKLTAETWAEAQGIADEALREDIRTRGVEVISLAETREQYGRTGDLPPVFVGVLTAEGKTAVLCAEEFGESSVDLRVRPRAAQASASTSKPGGGQSGRRLQVGDVLRGTVDGTTGDGGEVHAAIGRRVMEDGTVTLVGLSGEDAKLHVAGRTVEELLPKVSERYTRGLDVAQPPTVTLRVEPGSAPSPADTAAAGHTQPASTPTTGQRTVLSPAGREELLRLETQLMGEWQQSYGQLGPQHKQTKRLAAELETLRRLLRELPETSRRPG